MATLRKYLIAGLLVWLPIWVTFVIVKFLIDILDGTFSMLPATFQPEHWLGYNLPGLGVVVSILILLFTGFFVTHLLGHKLVALWESVLARIPLIRSIYSSVKQVAETLFKRDAQSFRKVLLVEYPRRDMWSIAFQTAGIAQEIQNKTQEKMVTVFIPTTPNPTSGFMIMVPQTDVIELDMKVEEGLKMVISLGVVQPNMLNNINSVKTQKDST